MARYDSLRKIKRNRALVDYRKNYPEASLLEIGEVFGISAQRVWEILKNEEQKEQAVERTTA